MLKYERRMGFIFTKIYFSITHIITGTVYKLCDIVFRVKIILTSSILYSPYFITFRIILGNYVARPLYLDSLSND